MARTIIRNISGVTLPLPAPYRGFVRAGNLAIVSTDKATTIANLGGDDKIRSVFEVDVADPAAPVSADNEIVAISGLDSSAVAPLADNALTPGIACELKLIVPDGATGDINFVLTQAVEIIECAVLKTNADGTAGNSVQLQNGSGNAITDAMSTAGADQTVSYDGTIDDSKNQIAAGGTLRVHRIKAGADASCIIYVDCIRR